MPAVAIATQHSPVASAAPARIGDWRVDVARNELRRGEEVVRLEPRVTEVLAYLIERPGEVVGREELLSAVWPGVVVGDDALTQAVIKLRKAFGDDAHNPTYIETISKRGYRLIAPVEGVASTSPGAGTVTWAPSPAPAHGPKRVALAIAVAGLLVLGGLTYVRFAETWRLPWPIGTGSPRGAAAAMPMVAVLPLQNLSGDPRRDYFSDGLTEDIISALGRYSALRVMSRNAVEPFKTRPATPQAVRTELGVRYVVKGSIRESDGRLRTAIELSDTEKGEVLWSQRYEGEGRQVFEIQDRIVTNIVGALAVKLTRLERERSAAKSPESLEAYDLVLRARELVYRMTRDTNRQARELLARAVQLAPDFGEAYVTLAHAEYRRADQGWMEDPDEGMRRVEVNARKALSLEDTGAHARAHAQLSRVHAQAGDLDQALVEAGLAVELNPSDPVSLYAQGSTLTWLGRLEEAVAALEMARRFDPSLDDIMLPLAYYTLGRYPEALSCANARIAGRPEAPMLHAVRAATLAQMGKAQEAKEAVAQVRRLSPFAQVELFATNFRSPEHIAKLHQGLRKAGM